MSGVYIKGFQLPKSCLDCKVHYVWNTGRPQCGITEEFIDDLEAYMQKRLDTCPMLSVPDHGRLGDLDKLESGLRLCAKYQTGDRQQGMLGCCGTIRTAPTVIPADKKETE